MSLAIAYSRGKQGISAPLVSIEVHITNGLPGLSIVGLPEAAVRESKDRVRSALINSHFEFPPRRITINLAPADLPKEGGRFDLAIALAILAASGQIDSGSLKRHECIGELSLSGELRPVSGLLPAALQVRDSGRCLIAPESNLHEIQLIDNIEAVGAHHLLDVCAHLNGQQRILARPQEKSVTIADKTDFSEVQGQQQAKRALEIAATGNHNLLMIGPPGTGKSMLAERFPTLLPPLSEQQALENAAIASISSNGIDLSRWRKPAYRSPHHTASAAALVGGGSNPMPGEISLAHHGVLFLDELPEFDRKVLEVLREPLETGKITISRATRQTDFPARFQLIAAMNPCPCGHLGDPSGRCHCTSEQVLRYRSKISGPLLDRIDMHIEVPRISYETLSNRQAIHAESSKKIARRVQIGREIATKRQGTSNAELTPSQIKQFCQLNTESDQILKTATEKLGLSPRAYHRILKVARTIADLAQHHDISLTDLSEAIGYRRLDRKS
ncbi:MAG: ATP-dependent protease [Gammaproteobacteria bacterium]|nr:MAG: ATP-dependent protease [Gammaproteobacteria bacterium]RLA22361.1 MAG: ATP-dependent protease [Gammaproteobacteria bacterium]